MKRWGVVAVVGAVLLAWILLTARADYNWSKSVIQAKGKQGWVVASTSDNAVDISHPWTIFKPAIYRVAFIRPNEVVWLERRHPAYRVLWVDRDLGEDEFTNVADCENRESAFVEDDGLVELLSLKLEWRSHEPGTPGAEIVRFVCNLK